MMSINVLLLLWMGLILSAGEAPVQDKNTDLYGNAVVSKILRIDQTCTLYCDIQDFPPIIGQNMPVKINGLKTADNIQYNQKIQKFLNELLLEKTETPPKVILENIQRGDTFCFCADIEIDGVDLCDLLVEKGLAKKSLKSKSRRLPRRRQTRRPNPTSKHRKEPDTSLQKAARFFTGPAAPMPSVWTPPKP